MKYVTIKKRKLHMMYVCNSKEEEVINWRLSCEGVRGVEKGEIVWE